MNAKSASDRLIVALDVPSFDDAIRAVKILRNSVTWFKVGSQLFTAGGPQIVRVIKDTGAKVFLDLKYHDIPTTVSLAGREAARMGVDMFNVHAFGGMRMMTAVANDVKEFCEGNGITKPIMLGVTVLTSMGADDLLELFIHRTPLEMVLHLARLVKKSGLDGVVASAKEAWEIKDRVDKKLLVVTPGIRPAWANQGDQQRIKTPKEAIRAGADFIVVGRPILGDEYPEDAAKKVIAEIEEAAW